MYRGTRVLAVLGTVLAWFPLAATVLISLAGSLVRGAFLFDYLMPAEFFPVALVGGGLLLWVAVRARLRRRWIAWSLGLAVALLAGVQGLAWAIGLASGEADAAGWRLAPCSRCTPRSWRPTWRWRRRARCSSGICAVRKGPSTPEPSRRPRCAQRRLREGAANPGGRVIPWPSSDASEGARDSP